MQLTILLMLLWVSGHAGVEGNELLDLCARNASQALFMVLSLLWALPHKVVSLLWNSGLRALTADCGGTSPTVIKVRGLFIYLFPLHTYTVTKIHDYEKNRIHDT